MNEATSSNNQIKKEESKLVNETLSSSASEFPMNTIWFE